MKLNRFIVEVSPAIVPVPEGLLNTFDWLEKTELVEFAAIVKEPDKPIVVIGDSQCDEGSEIFWIYAW